MFGVRQKNQDLGFGIVGIEYTVVGLQIYIHIYVYVTTRPRAESRPCKTGGSPRNTRISLFWVFFSGLFWVYSGDTYYRVARGWFEVPDHSDGTENYESIA